MRSRNDNLHGVANAPVVQCRARREIRTHAGNVRSSTLGTIVSEIDNLGRHLLQVHWGSGICAYVFPDEVEIVTPGISGANRFSPESERIRPLSNKN